MPRGTTTRTVHIGLPTRAAEFGRHRQFGATAESAGARQRARLRRESRRIPVHMTVLMRHRQALCPHREAQIGSAYHIIENASWTDSSPLSRIGIASTTTASASPSTPSCRSSRSCATSSRRTTGSPPAAGTSPTPPRGPTTWSMDVGGGLAAGRIGQAVMRRLAPFDVRLHYFDTHRWSGAASWPAPVRSPTPPARTTSPADDEPAAVLTSRCPDGDRSRPCRARVCTARPHIVLRPKPRGSATAHRRPLPIEDESGHPAPARRLISSITAGSTSCTSPITA